MIPLTRLNGDPVAINPDRIERAEVTPDIVLTMTDGTKYVIAESLDELIDRIRLFRASILALSQQFVVDADSGEAGRLRLVRGGSGPVVDRSSDSVVPDPVAPGNVAPGGRLGTVPDSDRRPPLGRAE
ncbi:MAG: flagellar FlbD family protein [Acidimicrobiales bacterium]